jgi:hypothetical protein
MDAQGMIPVFLSIKPLFVNLRAPQHAQSPSFPVTQAKIPMDVIFQRCALPMANAQMRVRLILTVPIQEKDSVRERVLEEN